MREIRRRPAIDGAPLRRSVFPYADPSGPWERAEAAASGLLDP